MNDIKIRKGQLTLYEKLAKHTRRAKIDGSFNLLNI